MKCPGCQSALKVPAIEEEPDDFEVVPDDFDEDVADDSPRPKSKRKSSSQELPIWVGYLKRFWFLAIPVITVPITLFSRNAFLLLGLGTIGISFIYMLVGFIPAVLVAPLYSLVPLVRMMTPLKERQRIWKQQAPYFAIFGKGLLVAASGGAALYVGSYCDQWYAGARRNQRPAQIQNVDQFSRPDSGVASSDAANPFPPSVADPNQQSPLAIPIPPAPGSSAAPGTSQKRLSVKPTVPGQGVMMNRSGKWVAARVDVIHPNDTVDVTLMTREVVRGVSFSDLYQMTPDDVAMHSGGKADTTESNPFQELDEPAKSPQNAPKPPTASGQISAEDLNFNIQAQSTFARRFQGAAKVGDSMVLEVVGFRHGACYGGKDRIYSTDTSIYVAAVHAGFLKEGERGRIKITMVNPLPNYPSLTQNGITSSSWPDTWAAIQISKVD